MNFADSKQITVFHEEMDTFCQKICVIVLCSLGSSLYIQSLSAAGCRVMVAAAADLVIALHGSLLSGGLAYGKPFGS